MQPPPPAVEIEVEPGTGHVGSTGSAAASSDTSGTTGATGADASAAGADPGSAPTSICDFAAWDGVDLLGFDPVMIMKMMQCVVGNLGFFEIIDAVAAVGVILIVVTQAYQAMTSGKGDHLQALFFKALVAAAILSATPMLRQTMHDMWIDSYTWAASSMGSANSITREAADAMATSAGTGDAGHIFLGLVSGATGLADMGASADGTFDFSDPADARGGREGDPVPEDAAAFMGGAAAGTTVMFASLVAQKTVLKAVRFIVLPIVAMFLSLMFASAFTIVLAQIFLPLTPMMFLTGVGMNAISRIVSIIAVAFLTVLVIPLVYSAVVTVGVYYPTIELISLVQDRAEQTTAAIEEWRTAMNIGLDEEVVDGDVPFWQFWKLHDQVNWGALTADAAAWIDTTLNMLMESIALLGGAILTAFLALYRLEEYITTFVGGMTGGQSVKPETDPGREAKQGVKDLDSTMIDEGVDRSRSGGKKALGMAGNAAGSAASSAVDKAKVGYGIAASKIQDRTRPGGGGGNDDEGGGPPPSLPSPSEPPSDAK